MNSFVLQFFRFHKALAYDMFSMQHPALMHPLTDPLYYITEALKVEKYIVT